MENLRNRVNIVLCYDEIKAKKLIALLTYKHVDIINENLVIIHRQRTRVYANKPTYIGFVVLEMSKAHMYRFHYDVRLVPFICNATAK